MTRNPLAEALFTEIARIPLIDSHSHIDPHRPTSRSLEDILGYHYYTELAHSAGMSKDCLAANRSPRERVRSVMTYMSRFDNTAQFGWFLEIAQTVLDYRKSRLDPVDADSLFDTAERVMAADDWETQVLQRSNLEKIFLTNDFDDPLQGFDTNRYVPCLRTDDLVFHFDKPEVRQRLARATGVEARDAKGMREALARLFDHFTKNGAEACAISLPPDFTPGPR